MTRCKITVLHREVYPEIAREQGIRDLVPCPILKEVQFIEEFPLLAVYGYHAYNHYENT